MSLEHVPTPTVTQTVSEAVELSSFVRMFPDRGLAALFNVGDGISLHLTGYRLDDATTPQRIDRLIDALHEMRAKVVELLAASEVAA